MLALVLVLALADIEILHTHSQKRRRPDLTVGHPQPSHHNLVLSHRQ